MRSILLRCAGQPRNGFAQLLAHLEPGQAGALGDQRGAAGDQALKAGGGPSQAGSANDR